MRTTWNRKTLGKKIKLVTLVEKDEALTNYISLISVDPRKLPKANYADTMAFRNRLIDQDRGQLIIRDFGRDKLRQPALLPKLRRVEPGA